jgi:hypothetical protein
MRIERSEHSHSFFSDVGAELCEHQRKLVERAGTAQKSFAELELALNGGNEHRSRKNEPDRWRRQTDPFESREHDAADVVFTMQGGCQGETQLGGGCDAAKTCHGTIVLDGEDERLGSFTATGKPRAEPRREPSQSK